MGKINILSKAAAEQIAAGEVVERPANAVKEMVENSIDAGAKSVVVEIRRGGVGLIRVTDDGGGILPEDLERAFMRHATSKIRDISDLEHVATLGFRGEALCSIASVSKTEMITKTPGFDLGRRIVVEGGETRLIEEAGCPDGTTVRVEELFYNTPARMKFLKKDSAEAALVTETCQRQALSHPQVSLRLIRDGKDVFFTPGTGDLTDAVRAVWGKDFSVNMGEVRYKNGGIAVTGLAGKNNLSRPNRSMQVFFVNGRCVMSRVLSLALAEAYKNELMAGRFPVAVLNVEMEPALCDVNVHPAKTEIKFADDQSVYLAVYWAVKNMLARAAGAREAQASYVREGVSFKIAPPPELPKQLKLRKPGGRFSRYTPPPKAPEPEKDGGQRVFRAEPNPLLPKKQIERLREEQEEKLRTGEIRTPAVGRAGIFEETVPKSEAPAPPEAEGGSEEPAAAEVRIIGQLFATYILAEGEGELFLVDQHAAHERLRYEELRKNGGKAAPQLLLIPVTVELSPAEAQAAEENRQFLNGLGFDFDEAGESSVLLRSVPSDCSGGDGEGLFVELLGDLMGDGRGELEDRRDRAVYTLACKSAIKANKDLSPKEMEVLIGRALALEGISTCPHGRPISIKITKYQIEKMFKRIV